MVIAVFVENPAGLSLKHHFDEQRGVLRAVSEVSRPYPFPYGFVLHTPAADGDNLDCFVLTQRQLSTGDIVDCEIIALMEQWEDGVVDHNLVARPSGEATELTETNRVALVEFVSHVFDHIPGKTVSAGRFLGEDEAHAHLAALRRT